MKYDSEDNMRKIFAMIVAAAMAGTALAGCTDEVQVEESSSRVERISSSPIDPAIIGEWSSGANGYIFKEDRLVSLPIDFSSSAHFNSDGSFSMETTTVEKDEIEFDGSSLRVSHSYGEADDSDILLLDMKRIGAADSSSYDGRYELLDGSYRDLLAYNLAIDTEKIKVEAVVDGESLCFTVVDYCYYETLGNSLELFSENMNYKKNTDNAVKYEYKIEGDTLTLTYEDGAQEILTRVE